MWGTIAKVVTAVAGWVEAHPKLTGAILITAAAVTGIVAAIAALVVIVATVGIAILALVSSPIAIFIAAIVAIGVGITALAIDISSNWKNITAFTGVLVNDIKALWQDLVTWVTNLVDGWYNDSMAKINAALNAIKGIGSAIGGGVSGAVNAVGGAASSVFNTITHLASGGIVTQPTFALIGEAGPEAVVPLSGMTGGGSFGGSGSININIGSLQGTDQQAAIKFANQIARILNQQLKLKNY